MLVHLRLPGNRAHHGGVLPETGPKQRDHGNAHHRDHTLANRAPDGAAQDPAPVIANPVAFGEHHLLEQIVQEIAAPFAGQKPRCSAPCPAAHRAQNLINRRPVLRAGGEIKTAQNGPDCLRLCKHGAQERRHIPFQQGHLFGKVENGDPGGGIRFFYQAVRDLIRQAADQSIEFARYGAMCLFAAVSGLKCRAPDHLAAALVKGSEILAKACDHVRLGKDHIDRHMGLERRVQLGQPGAHRLCVTGQPLGAFRHKIGTGKRQNDPVDRLVGARGFQLSQER